MSIYLGTTRVNPQLTTGIPMPVEEKWEPLNDGNTHFWVKVDEDLEYCPANGFTWIWFEYQTNPGETVTLDWGDGTVETLPAKTNFDTSNNAASVAARKHTHTYTSNGDFRIDVSGFIKYGIGSFDNQGHAVGNGQNGGVVRDNFTASKRVYYAEFAKVVNQTNYLAGSLFFNSTNLREMAVTMYDGEEMWAPVVASSSFNNCHNLKTVKIDCSKLTSTTPAFQDCWSLKSVTGNLDFRNSSQTSLASLFQGCYELEEIPTIYLDNIKTASNIFNKCYSLKKVKIHGLKSATTIMALFNECHSIEDIEFEGDFDLSKVTSCSNMFYFCVNLKRVPFPLNVPLCNTFSTCWRDCASLEEEPDITLGTMCNFFYAFAESGITKVTRLNTSFINNFQSMFQGATSLQEVPDNFNFSNIENANGIAGTFMNCFSLKKFPTHVTGPNKSFAYSLDFSSCQNIEDFDTLAEFDSNGNIVGGMVYYINNVSNGSNFTRTIKFHANIKNHFTENQKTAIASAFTTKGWTLNW